MRDFKETFKLLEQELTDPSQCRNFEEVYDKLSDRIDDYSSSKEHAELQLICAHNFIKQGYRIDVEHNLREPSSMLVCDIHSKFMNSTLIAEVEIGYYFNPEQFVVNMGTYNRPIDKSLTRIVSKISRYSVHADRFGIVVYKKQAVPKNLQPSQLRIPSLLLDPPMTRDEGQLDLLKRKADEFYTKPKIAKENIRYGKITYVYVVDPDRLTVERYSLRKPEPQA